FTRDVAGNWSQSAFLTAATPVANENFGSRVALEGNSLVVGAKGKVYYSEFSEGAWSGPLLVGSEATNIDFPYSLAISNGKIVAGSRTGTSDGSLGTVNNSGFVNVYTKNNDAWELEQMLQATNAQNGDEFGFAVGIDDNTVIVGARQEDGNATGVGGEDNNSASTSGAAYIFEYNADSGAWTETAYLKASNTGNIDRFGSAVAIDGDVAVVGAPYEDGSATSINGDGTDNGAADAGAAYVFNRMGDAWIAGDYIKAPNAGAGDFFGSQVALSGTTLLVSSPRESSSSRTINGGLELDDQSRAGALYVFTPGGTLPDPQEVKTEVEFLDFDPGDPLVRLYEGDSSSGFNLIIRRTSSEGELTVSFHLVSNNGATPGDLSFSANGAEDPDVVENNGIYTVTFSSGDGQLSYRVRAVSDGNLEAETEEQIIFEFVESDDYDINNAMNYVEFSIRPQGLLVTNTNDFGTGSLRQAIINANLDMDFSTITFSDGSDGFTDFFDGASRTIYLSETLVIMNPTQIDGPGKDALALSGNSNGDFKKDPGECNLLLLEADNVIYGRPVLINNLTFKDGIAGFPQEPWDPEYNPPFGSLDRHGGLIQIKDIEFALYLEDCRFMGGRAASSGGAIYPQSISRLEVYRCEFIENQAVLQGGAVVGSIFYPYFEDCIFLRNRARQGGACAETSAFIRCEFSYNKAEMFMQTGSGPYAASAYGGAVYLSQAEATFGDCLFYGNQAIGYNSQGYENSSNAYGGAIYSAAVSIGEAPLLIYNSTFAKNSVLSDHTANGGALYYFIDPAATSSQDPVSPIRMFQCTVSNNEARSRLTGPQYDELSAGGGIYMLAITDETLLDNCTITQNKAKVGAGMAIFRFEKPDVYQSIFAGNYGEDITPIGPYGYTPTANDPTRGGVNSLGYNIFGTGMVAGDFSSSGDQTGILDPGLGPLADNGGLVLTHNLLSYSPALDAGDPNPMYRPYEYPGSDLLETAWEKDVRGGDFGSEVGSGRDIGALEFDPSVTTVIPLAVDSVEVQADGAVHLYFASNPGSTYFLEYSDTPDNFTRSTESLIADSKLSVFVDDGPPLTDSPVGTTGRRIYRIVQEEL
ncbi:MAG: FG-GAP repeat protein, partial [Verrucomicrobiae bacterium]|nr:FG-GAP repeat protein [Verrucomicrobiae bacterium]